MIFYFWYITMNSTNILSIDAALRRTGWSVINSGGELLSYGLINTPKDINDFQRLIYISNNIKELMDIYNVNILLIEDVYYLRNIKTYCLLSQLNGVLRFIGYERLGNNVFVLPTTFIRSVFNLKTKKEVFEFVINKFGLHHLNFTDHNDICDSIIIGMSFIAEDVYKTKKMISIEKTNNIDLTHYLTDAYINNNESLVDIAKKLKVGYNTLYSWVQNLKIPIKEDRLLNYMELTNDQEQVLLGTIVGVGDLYRSNKHNNYCLQIEHKLCNKKYLVYKSSFFESLFYSLFDVYKIKQNAWFSIFRTVYCELFNKYVELIYYNDRKVISSTFLDKLGPLGVSIWFRDSGYYRATKQSEVIGIDTTAFSYDENVLIQKWFLDKFGIDFRIVKYKTKYWYLKTGKKNNILKFSDIISEYIDISNIGCDCKYNIK